jgi:hypothetical protein
MISVDKQLHGYTQGHQLLASSTKLSKEDQELVNRLSDIAGPIGPGESFKPYLTAYPLPSGAFYILSRTWQDLEVARAGCVRTISLLIPMPDWESAPSIVQFLALLGNDFPSVLFAEKTCLESTNESQSLPQISGLQSVELLEALFLEDRQPIAVFDLSDAELIAVRILTALWPSFRRKFSLSTFALSPRTISGRSFDLVFAPKEARSRFSNWEGRKLNARSGGVQERHPWASRIAQRVFDAPMPSLMDKSGFLASDASGNESALRISLLRDDLLAKLERSPTAALGLLDIANTRSIRDTQSIRDLEPALARAARKAVQTMPPEDAWSFLAAMMRKLQNLQIGQSSAQSIHASAIELTSRFPAISVHVLSKLEDKGVCDFLLQAVADALALQESRTIVGVLPMATSAVFIKLLIASPILAQRALVESEEVSTSLAIAMAKSEPEVIREASAKLLPFLVDEIHAAPAALMIGTLDRQELVKEAVHLYDTNRLDSDGLRECIAVRAIEINAESQLRETAIRLGPEKTVERLIAALLRPNANDLAWVLVNRAVYPERGSSLLLDLLRSGTQDDLVQMLTRSDLLESVVSSIPDTGVDQLHRILRLAPMPLGSLVSLLLRVLSIDAASPDYMFISFVLNRCLREQFEGDEVDTLTRLFEILGSHLNGPQTINASLAHSNPSSVACRNIVALQRASSQARVKILIAIEEFAAALKWRNVTDLDMASIDACASIFVDALEVYPEGQMNASVSLLPLLMNARSAPISALVAAVFPSAYRKFQRDENSANLFSPFAFFNVERSKLARREIVDAFLASAWRPSDLALAGARAGDLPRVLNRLIRQKGGEQYLELIERDLDRIPSEWRKYVSATVRAAVGKPR